MSARQSSTLLTPNAPTGTYDRIPIEKLLFDAKNPRLAEFVLEEDATQLQVVQSLWKFMAIQEIAMSIAHNGYFNHEPLFVESTDNSKFVVIEGNRRLAAVRLLLDAELRERLKATDLPTITAGGHQDLLTLPATVTTGTAACRYHESAHVNAPAT